MKAMGSMIVGYLIFMNMIGFVSMGIDKKRAIKGVWRISERTLLLIGFVGGGFGTFCGMYLFRHKTKHLKFVILIPVSVVIYLSIYLYLFLTLR